VDALATAYPDAWEAILAANNEAPPLTLRVDGDRAGYLAELAEAGIEAEADPAVDTAVRLREFLPVSRLPGFDDGRVSVQDAAAQRIAPLVDPHPEERILDACAAPGGKLDHILTLAPGVAVLGLDVDAGRLERVRETLARTGQTGAELLPADAADPGQWWDGEPFDAALVDAPCSGTGVIRRHPDIKHLRRPDDLAPMTARQDALLDAAWSVLAPGGRLVYATCSVLPEENTGRVAGFQERYPEAVLRDPEPHAGRDTGHGRQLLPGPEGDGFFYAVLERPA
jgi:16S rRNA (cytosine967-C5)-methyltransferase